MPSGFPTWRKLRSRFVLREKMSSHKHKGYTGWLALVLVFIVSTAASCKMHYGFTQGTKAADEKTVSVQFFQVNASLAKPTAGQVFTEALKDIMQSQGKLQLVNKGGDLNFEGAITGYSVAPVSLQAGDQAAANRLTMTVNVKFTNEKDEKKSFESSFSRFADFPSSQNLSSVEDDLIKNITDQIVQDIFNRAIGNW